MSASSGWELASGGSNKETGLSALFKGASLIGRNGEAVSVLTTLRDRTVLLYFAAGHADSCKPFSGLLSKFYDAVRETDDSIVVIFVSNDKSREEQLAFFRGEGMHAEWLMVEWTYDLEDIMDNFKVETLPSLIVVDRDGKAVVEKGCDAIFDIFTDERGKLVKDHAKVKAAVAEKWMDWRRAAGDWRASAGHTLGGSGSSGGGGDSSVDAALTPAAVAAAAPAAGAGVAAQSDQREALRAARLAALDRRMGGAATGSSSSSAAASSGGVGPPGVATLRGGTESAQAMSGSGKASGSGTFADGSAAAKALAAGGSAAYTLAGGRVELPPPAAGSVDGDVASDVASAGNDSMDMDGDDLEMDMEEACARLVSMGFLEEHAREALQAAGGDVERAGALLVGDV